MATVLALVGLVALPAGAGTSAGHLHSTAADNPGTQNHLGAPLHPPQDTNSDGDMTDGTDNDACGEFTSHNYRGSFPAGKGTVDFAGKTFTQFEVTATWIPSVATPVFYAGPRGTYPDTNCQRNQVGESYSPVQGRVVGKNATNDTLVCEPDGNSGGTWKRNLIGGSGSDKDNLTYNMTDHTCTARDADGDPQTDSDVDIEILVKVLSCVTPITPPQCTSEGRGGSDNTAVTLSGL